MREVLSRNTYIEVAFMFAHDVATTIRVTGKSSTKSPRQAALHRPHCTMDHAQPEAHWENKKERMR